MKKEYTIKLKETMLDSEDADKLVIMPYHQADLKRHNHHFFELVYITGGTAVHTLNDISTSLKEGDYFIVDFGSEHSYEDSRDLTLINCLFLPEIIDDTLRDCCSFETLIHGCMLRYYKLYLGRTAANQIFHDEDGRIFRLLNGMTKEYQEKKVGYTEIFRCRLLEILILTMRNIVDSTYGMHNSTMVLNAIQYINGNYQNQKILSGFCEQFHFSPQYVSRRFKQETGFTIKEYLQKVRMEKSCELLSGSDMFISEIAQAVGYTDVKFFNVLFRRTLKMSPREYRKISS